MKTKFQKFYAGIGLVAALTVAASVNAFDFTDPEVLSKNDLANKTKLVRLTSGLLISVYGDAQGPLVYDTKSDAVRSARDIFVRTCHTATKDCSAEVNWTAPVNISNTATQTSILTDWSEAPGVIGATPFYGDSDKPNIFNSGNFAVVTWVDKFCPGGKQRMIKYNERDEITVPFSCVYASRMNPATGVWKTFQLTDGERDAKQDANKGLSVGDPAVGHWIITWQEDPRGLQIGGADGPGDGASGANVTHGTDIWYTWTENLYATTPWADPVRITNNYTTDGKGGNTSPIFHPDNPEQEIEVLERGNTGSSRANVMLVSGSTPATAVIAYEENKGANRLDSGKFVRYHQFAFNNPPIGSAPHSYGEPGCIISDPNENSRRVRFVTQKSASLNGLRMGIFWRQGEPTEGGPGDIMVRRGMKTSEPNSTGLRPEDMVPHVDHNCRALDYQAATNLENITASNISSNTIPWSPVPGAVPVPAPTNNLDDATGENPYENARAHRAVLRGEDLYIGYTYVKDWAVSNYTDMDNYNFWVRHYNAATGNWTVAENLSKIVDPKINVKEPRLVGTPGPGPGCGTVYEENCQDKNTLIVAWGTESNVYAHVESSEEFDIYYTRTRDKGLTYEPTTVIGDIGVNNRFESQLRPSPQGNIIYSVWNERDNENKYGGGTYAMLSVSNESTGTPPSPAPIPDPEDDLGSDCPCTLWVDSTIPGMKVDPDNNAVELGVKFQTDTAGKITGITFYKGISNLGPHKGYLWKSDGTLLASVEFTGESSEGWQKAYFSQSVDVLANTTYIASYHTQSGYYSADTGYFLQEYNNGPLTALMDSIGERNGVYRYGAGGVYPSNTWNQSNYWVSPIFSDQ